MNDSSIANSSLNASTLDTSMSSVSDKKKKSLDDFEVVEGKTGQLGKGSFATVKLVKEKENPNKLYAMKIINKKDVFEHSSPEYLKREIKVHKKLDHPHIVKLKHYFEDKENVYLVMEYAEHGNLFYYIRRKKRLLEKEAFIYFFQTCLGIDYLHKKDTLHRDLKPENLLMDKMGNIKICDFGWCAENSQRTTICGTIEYIAPEMIESKEYNYKIDIWSLGVLLYELLHGYPPFRGQSQEEKLKNIVAGNMSFSPDIADDAKDLIKLILDPEPSKRLDFDEIFKHKWMKRLETEFKINMNSYLYQGGSKKKKDSRRKKNSTKKSDKLAEKKDTPESTPKNGEGSTNPKPKIPLPQSESSRASQSKSPKQKVSDDVSPTVKFSFNGNAAAGTFDDDVPSEEVTPTSNRQSIHNPFYDRTPKGGERNKSNGKQNNGGDFSSFKEELQKQQQNTLENSPGNGARKTTQNVNYSNPFSDVDVKQNRKSSNYNPLENEKRHSEINERINKFKEYSTPTQMSSNADKTLRSNSSNLQSSPKKASPSSQSPQNNSQSKSLEKTKPNLNIQIVDSPLKSNQSKNNDVSQSNEKNSNLLQPTSAKPNSTQQGIQKSPRDRNSKQDDSLAYSEGSERVSTQPRVTNIDKYISNYLMEDDEEIMLLNKLDNFYTTGQLVTPRGQEKQKIEIPTNANSSKSPDRATVEGKRFTNPVQKEKPPTHQNNTKQSIALIQEKSPSSRQSRHNIDYKNSFGMENNFESKLSFGNENDFQFQNTLSQQQSKQQSQTQQQKAKTDSQKPPIASNQGQKNNSRSPNRDINPQTNTNSQRKEKERQFQEKLSPKRENQSPNKNVRLEDIVKEKENINRTSRANKPSVGNFSFGNKNGQVPKYLIDNFEELNQNEQEEVLRRLTKEAQRQKGKYESPYKGLQEFGVDEDDEDSSRPFRFTKNKSNESSENVRKQQQQMQQSQQKELAQSKKEKIDFEADREQLLRLYKDKLNSFDSPGKMEKIDEILEKQYGQHTNEEGYSPEKALEKLLKSKANTDLDLSFIPRQYLYNFRKMDDSYKDLNDKKKQLDEYFFKMDDEEQRQTVSRISHRMNNRINRKFGDDSDEEEAPGIFEKVFGFLGCIGSRNSQNNKK